jgi:hypothetical protein
MGAMARHRDISFGLYGASRVKQQKNAATAAEKYVPAFNTGKCFQTKNPGVECFRNSQIIDVQAAF